ncbi:MAG: hypothetical protein WCC92_02935, partial [Candidatus Korobacteraceae bacterium]
AEPSRPQTFRRDGLVGCAPDGRWSAWRAARPNSACNAASVGATGRRSPFSCINLAGDTTNAVIAHDWRTLIGLPIGGAMVVYLLTKRSAFAP